MNASHRVIRNVASVLTIPLVLCCMGATAKHITTASDARAQWTESLNSEDAPIQFYAAGATKEIFSIATGIDDDHSTCDEMMDQIEAARGFAMELRSRGFTQIACGDSVRPLVVPREPEPEPACCKGNDVDSPTAFLFRAGDAQVDAFLQKMYKLKSVVPIGTRGSSSPIGVSYVEIHRSGRCGARITD